MRSAISTSLVVLCLLTAPALVLAQDFRLDSGVTCQEREPDVAALPGGGFVAVWQQGEEPAIVSQPRIFARIFGAGGTPVASEFLVNGNAFGHSPEAAANAAGNFVVVWLDHSGQVRSRAYGPGGAILGPVRSLSSGSGLAVTATHDGGFAVVIQQGDAVFLVRLGSTGQPQGLPQPLTSVTYPFPITGFRDLVVAAYGPSGVVVGLVFEDNWVTSLMALAVTSNGEVELLDLGVPGLSLQVDVLRRSRLAVAANAAGQILVTWTLPRVLSVPVLQGRVFGADRQPLGPPFDIGGGSATYLSPPDAVANDVDGSGDFLVAWHSLSLLPPDSDAIGSIARIRPDGRLVQPYVHAWDTIAAEGPSLIVDSQGRAVVAWQLGDNGLYIPAVETCYSSGLFARQVGVASDVLLLQDNRFEIRARWTAHDGSSGEGRAVPLTGDSGYFWFFGEDNVELMVKVLDGRAVNGQFWVFYGSLSDVAFTVEVTDTATGQTKTYGNPAGQLASHADTAAFPGTAPATAAGIASGALRSHVPSDDGAGPCTSPDLPVVRRPGLCLAERFEVEVAWHAGGETGLGEGVQLTRDSGYLWFFDDDNIELVVKVLDGRAVNGHFWVFYGALSDVEYTVLVRDIVTGEERTYHNPAGQLRSHADTAAF